MNCCSASTACSRQNGVIRNTISDYTNADSHPRTAKKIHTKKGLKEKTNTLSAHSTYCNVIRVQNIYLWREKKAKSYFLIDLTAFTTSGPSPAVHI